MGEVAPHERRPEGPFGDHYGYYSLRHDYPVFRVHTVAHRHDAIYPATVVGKPRQEDFFIGDLLQELLSPLFPLVMPAVEQLWSYGETGYHSLAAAVVKQRYPREAMASAFRILGEGQLSLQKFLLADRSARRPDATSAPRSSTCWPAPTPRTDLYVFGHLSMDTLDYTGPRGQPRLQGRVDGARRSGARAAARVRAGGAAAARCHRRARVLRRLPRRAAPAVSPTIATRRPRLAAHPAFAGWPLLVVSDEPARAARSTVNFLWTTFTRFEPAADIHAARVSLERNHVVFTPPVAIDARMKPWYPAELAGATRRRPRR